MNTKLDTFLQYFSKCVCMHNNLKEQNENQYMIDAYKNNQINTQLFEKKPKQQCFHLEHTIGIYIIA